MFSHIPEHNHRPVRQAITSCLKLFARLQCVHCVQHPLTREKSTHQVAPTQKAQSSSCLSRLENLLDMVTLLTVKLTSLVFILGKPHCQTVPSIIYIISKIYK
jgi:hypothetical protein